MQKITLAKIGAYYRNNGQQAERVFRYTLTGVLEKADNKPHTLGGDCGNIQVKSAKATVCTGLDLGAYLDKDGATAWAYVAKDLTTAYIMERNEWESFVKEFSYSTYESQRHGGGAKLRLKSESKKMAEWLERATATK